MVAGNPCYSGDSGLPLLPSSTNPAGNQYNRARQGDTPPPAVVNPGANIRLTVGNCYEADVPIVTNTPDAIDSPRVTLPRPPTIDDTTPPPAATAADLIRIVVDNCYGDDIPLSPATSVPGQNPRNRKGQEEPIPPTAPGETIRQIVENCYGPTSPALTPRPAGPPRTRQGEPPAQPGVNPGQVIRDIVERCYPVVPVPDITAPTNPGVAPLIDLDPIGPLSWLCDMFPELPICSLFPIGPLIPDGPIIPTPPGGDDCKEVAEGLSNETVEISSRPDEAAQGIFYVLESGKKLVCKGLGRDGGLEPPPGDWDKCVKTAVECIFKPYTTGTWRTPGADCNTFYIRGQNSTTGQICIENCQGGRNPIYEYKAGAGARNVMLAPISNGKNGSGSFLKHNLRVCTTDTMGNYNGGKVFCEAGNLYFNSTSIQTYTVSLGGASVTFKCRGVLDGNEYDSEWWVDGFTGSLPASGTKTTYTFNAGRRQLSVILEVTGAGAKDHRYGLSPTPDKPGYVNTGPDPAFYVLQEQAEGSVPLFRFYSAASEDTLLTINPGKPDSRGEGIRAFLDAYGYTEGQLLGYVYKNSALAGKSLRADEEIQELHGYARRGSVDLEATFNSNNDLVVTGSGSGKIKVEIKWDDNPNTAGTAFDTLTCGGLSFTRSGERGSASGMLDVTGGNTYTVSGTNYGVSRKNGNRTLCLKDNDGSDCNATVNLGGLETTSLSTFTDHKYSTELMAVKETPVRYHRTRLSYKIPLNPVSSVVISYNIIKGSAGYQNSWGVAITNEEGNQIYWARVIEDNTTRDIETTQYTIPYDVLIQYPRKEIVFFLVPDGNGGLSSGQDISFTYQNPGWKNSASTENDWVFFSNSKMNPTESQGSSSRSKVRYNGNNWQWWEDLLDGDDDYDDFKVYYEYMMPGSDYKYDGIECYVFEEPSPTPIMMDVIVREQCEKPLFDGTFVDATVTRTGCGSPLPVSDSTYNNATVGKCTGPYVIEINRNQNLKAYRSATLQLKAYGALIQAPESEDIRFQYKLKKNGVVIHEDKLEIRDWPRVGADLGPQFSVADDDVIRFEVDGPFRGPASGNTSVGFILYDVNDGVFEKPWNVNLITSPGAGEAVGRSRTVSNDPVSVDTGSVKKLSIQLWDHISEAWTDKVYVWDNGGQLNTNGQNGQAASWNDEYYGGNQYADVNYGGNRQIVPGFYEGGTRHRRGHIMSSNIDADDTWTDRFVGNQFDRGIFYNSLFEHARGLLCRPDKKIDILERGYYHLSNTHGFMAWFVQYAINMLDDEQSEREDLHDDIDEYYAKGIVDGNANGYPMGTVVTSNGMYSKMSFMHDYILGQVGNDESITDVGGNAKLRMAFWPYTVTDSQYDDNSDDDENQRYGSGIYWSCAVECFDVIDGGDSYQVGQQFEMQWPPAQKQKGKYQNESGSVTPYYPRDEGANVPLPKEITPANTVGATDRIARRFMEDTYTPREVFYQESHNRDSNLWYLCQSERKVDRVKFKITIEEIQ